MQFKPDVRFDWCAALCGASERAESVRQKTRYGDALIDELIEEYVKKRKNKRKQADEQKAENQRQDAEHQTGSRLSGCVAVFLGDGGKNNGEDAEHCGGKGGIDEPAAQERNGETADAGCQRGGCQAL